MHEADFCECFVFNAFILTNKKIEKDFLDSKGWPVHGRVSATGLQIRIQLFGTAT